MHVDNSSRTSETFTPQSHLNNFSNSEDVILSQPLIQEQDHESSVYDIVTRLPFLLLDVRDIKEYNAGHIVCAHHYSPSMMQRAGTQYSKEILHFRNRPDKLIIIYDSNETLSAQVATQFCERDIQNVWIVSGGLEALIDKVPRGAVLGNVKGHEHGWIFGHQVLQNAVYSADPESTITDASSSRSLKPQSRLNQSRTVRQYNTTQRKGGMSK